MFCPKCGTENPETGKFCRSCGTDLGNVSAVLSGELKPSVAPQTYIDRKGRVRSNDPTDILSHAIRSSMMGIGFLIASLVLLFTNMANGHTWWWAMLFPAFASLATGISQFVKYGHLEEKRKANIVQQPSLTNNQPFQSLPPTQAEYIKPQGSIYDTGDLTVPPSVTENTTRHLEINKEGETMTLPKTNKN
jgi:hypothetical protein